MQTLHGIRFMPIVRIDGTLVGLDVRWLRGPGLAVVLLLALATPAGPLHPEGGLPLWVRVAIGLSSVGALLLTALGHELGHALAGRLSGLKVRAILLAPQGSVTIRASSPRAAVNLRTALAGPLASAVCAGVCAGLARCAAPESFGADFLTDLGVLQLVSGIVNLVPLGAMDGRHIVAAWRDCRAVV